jgi:hypothetical protein
LILAVATGAATREATANLVRESRRVDVGGRHEQWSLEWKTPPVPECVTEDAGAFTCLCIGFAFGERGEIDLVRRAGTEPEDRLPLGPLFDDPMMDWGGMAVIPRWPLRNSDSQDIPEAAIRRRPPVRIMELRDYDHDGAATEFFLQTGTLPCGKRMGIVLGVSRDRPTLHAFTSVAHPERPLFLRTDQWEALARARGPVDRIDWLCGDHAADDQYEVTLTAAAGRISVTQRIYACTPGPEWKKGRLVRSEPR